METNCKTCTFLYPITSATCSMCGTPNPNQASQTTVPHSSLQSSSDCKGGCGFTGRSETEGYCSVCYRNHLRSQGVDVPDPNAKAGLGKESVLKGQEQVAGAVIQVRLGDMTCEKVDCIVNAANKSLDHSGGLAAAICRKGGRSIQDESDIWISQPGNKLEDGGVAVTNAGALPAQYVLHCVGPMWRTGLEEEAKKSLRLGIYNCLVACDDRKCASLSIPAISSGIFGFPRPLCAEILFDTAATYLIEHEGKTNIREVRFTNFDENSVQHFIDELERRKALQESQPNGDGDDAVSDITVGVDTTSL